MKYDGKNRRILFLFLVLSSFLFFFPIMASAEAGAGGEAAGTNLTAIATNLTGAFTQIAKMITAGAYLAGAAFALGAIMKFKQHKDNPQQIPIGQPIALIFIAAALMFLPTLYNVAGKSLFGSAGGKGTLSGSTF
ncbi:MAG: hypothetical protein ACD_44C00371G0008 [uncultured bacterium]|nr:MAG: hypothetical protein ACD_44C00371G0008 [uncultured bacterium]OGT16077.1 MAG: hypothetical protein A3B69_00585 [Gammaproteobacteria bacterium RIFCSPHIGHO2_02_FULL_38_33]OGT77784.1 MAG: hypothetical protein A3G71_06060 [Gammaproteobacteria bacterium RIFCSPLOWO2_12_FULL_38_14]